MVKYFITVTAILTTLLSPTFAADDNYKKLNSNHAKTLFDLDEDELLGGQASVHGIDLIGIVDQSTDCSETLQQLAAQMHEDEEATANLAIGALREDENSATTTSAVLLNVGNFLVGANETQFTAASGTFLFVYHLAQPEKVASAIYNFDETLQCGLAGLEQGTVGAIAQGYRVGDWREVGSGVGNLAILGVSLGASAELSAASMARIGKGLESQAAALLNSVARPVMNGTHELALAPAFAFAIPVAESLQIATAVSGSTATALGGGNMLMMTGQARHYWPSTPSSKYIPQSTSGVEPTAGRNAEGLARAYEPLPGERTADSIVVWGVNQLNVGQQRWVVLANSWKTGVQLVRATLEKIIVKPGESARLVFGVDEVRHVDFWAYNLYGFNLGQTTPYAAGAAKIVRTLRWVNH